MTELFSEVRRTGQVRLEHAARIIGLRGHADTHDGAGEDGGRCDGCEALGLSECYSRDRSSQHSESWDLVPGRVGDESILIKYGVL